MEIPPVKQLNRWMFTEAMLLGRTKGLFYQNEILDNNKGGEQR